MKETPGTADEPKILAMADEIARLYPEMQSYCDQYNTIYPVVWSDGRLLHGEGRHPAAVRLDRH